MEAALVAPKLGGNLKTLKPLLSPGALEFSAPALAVALTSRVRGGYKGQKKAAGVAWGLRSASENLKGFYCKAVMGFGEAALAFAAPGFMTEFTVDMPCGGCAKTVRSTLQCVEGVQSIEIDIEKSTVRILATASLQALLTAMEKTGKTYKLVSHESPADSPRRAVAEWKGAVIGVARITQITHHVARIDAAFAGLPPGPAQWSVHAYGDLRRGAASTGHPYVVLGELMADEAGNARYAAAMEGLEVADLIGRAMVLYGKEGGGDVAAVVAMSGHGEGVDCLCACDGSVLWRACARTANVN